MPFRKVLGAFRTKPIRDDASSTLLSAKERKDIERSFARGNVHLHEGDYVTKEDVDALRKQVLPPHVRSESK